MALPGIEYHIAWEERVPYPPEDWIARVEVRKQLAAVHEIYDHHVGKDYVRGLRIVEVVTTKTFTEIDR